MVGLLAALSWANPWLGALASIAIGVAAWFLAGWSFRLLVFGTVFSFDILFFRRARPERDGVRGFSAPGLGAVPRRTWGVFARVGGGWEFRYRPWLVLAARSIACGAPRLVVGRGLLNPVVLDDRDGSRQPVLVVLPPRFRGCEDRVAGVLGTASVRDIGVRRGIRAAWAWAKEAWASFRLRFRQGAEGHL